MASSGIFELVAGTVVHADDVFVYVNVHDATQSPQGSTLKITSADLWANAQPITIAGPTVTVSTPVLNLSQTWNASGVAFTAIKLNITNTASNTGSLLLDLQVDGTSKASIGKTGALVLADGVTAAGVTSTLDQNAVVLKPATSGTACYVQFQDSGGTQIGYVGFVVGTASGNELRLASGTGRALHLIAGSGTYIFENLPTSASGLPTGALWNSSGVVHVA
jgi:hypothetical protein